MSFPIRFKSVSLRNFMSFGNVMTEVDLSMPGSTLIFGENMDTNSNNGAGKTTIINAITYACFNKPFDPISLQKLINSTNNTKNTLMEVKLTFDRGADEFEIYRCRGETFNIKIICNGEDITLDSVTENDKLVEEIIGVSYELFTKIVIFSGNSTPFLFLPVSQQRQQIEELFNITLLTEKAVKLKEQIRTTEQDIKVQEAVAKEQESAIALFNKQVADAERRVQQWDAANAQQIKQTENSIAQISAVDFDTETQLHAGYTEITAAVSQMKSQVALLKKDETQLKSDVSKLQSEVKHLVEAKCPYCLQSYEGAQDKLTEKQATLEEKSERLAEVSTTLQRVSTELSMSESDMREIKAALAFSSLEEALNSKASLSSLQNKLIDLQSAINPHVEAHREISSQLIGAVSYDRLNELKKLLEHQQFLHKLLTDKNSFLRRRIINKTIPFLNNRLLGYTKSLGLPHIVKFDDDMSCVVSEYGRELDFGNLSSGEKKRVNLSLSLAFRDVLHHLHATVNVLFIDEIDASLDAPGVESVFKLLKEKTRDDHLSMWIISHRPEAVGRFDQQLVIRKQNGFSSIVSGSGSTDFDSDLFLEPELLID